MFTHILFCMLKLRYISHPFCPVYEQFVFNHLHSRHILQFLRYRVGAFPAKIPTLILKCRKTYWKHCLSLWHLDCSFQSKASRFISFLPKSESTPVCQVFAFISLTILDFFCVFLTNRCKLWSELLQQFAFLVSLYQMLDHDFQDVCMSAGLTTVKFW